MGFSSAILILTISVMLGACAAPKLVAPRVEHPSYAELVAKQPDCTVILEELEAAGGSVDPETGCTALTDELVLAGLWCYRGVWKFWEEEYRVLDAKLRAMEPAEEIE